ncbi:MAG TPA: DUF2277 domain-containing protein [Gemmatimonadales bacterium]
MCRNIKRLRHADHAPSDAELHDAALQFVRKISGFTAPSSGNQDAFDRAVHDVAAVSRTLFDSLRIRGQPLHRHPEPTAVGGL